MSASRSASPLVLVEDAGKQYGETAALAGVNLEVRAGEVLGIVGHRVPERAR